MTSDRRYVVRALDAAFMPVVFYVSLWVYELSNYIVFSLSESLGNALRYRDLSVGVMAVGHGSADSVLAKPPEMGIATGRVLRP